MAGIFGLEKQKIKQHLFYKSLIVVKRVGTTTPVFGVIYTIIYLLLTYAKTAFAPEAIPWADAFASATAYTGMWLMAKKKVESWVWWILTNIASIPLYFIKGYAFTSVQFIVLLILAIAGLVSWQQKAKEIKIN